jgi:hypothetical protein
MLKTLLSQKHQNVENMNCTNFKLCCAFNVHYAYRLQFLEEMVHNSYGKKTFGKNKMTVHKQVLSALNM